MHELREQRGAQKARFSNTKMATPADAATASPESSISQSTSQLWEKREGHFVCLERHLKSQPVTCGKNFASKQALEAHRRRTGRDAAKLPSDRPVSRLHGLDPEAAHQVRHVRAISRPCQGTGPRLRENGSSSARVTWQSIGPSP
jgi:hypothetical protein